MIWKHFLLCGTLFASVLLTVPSPASACGWDPEWDNEYYRFMAPEMAGQEMYAPFQFTWDNLYSYNLMDLDFEHDTNAEDWAAYFGEGIKREDVLQVIYKMSPQDLAAVQEKARGQRDVLPGKLSENALVRQWSKGKWGESLDYLQYALRCEPHCVAGDGWQPSGADASQAGNLIREGMDAYRSTKDDFIKLRYAYQVIRLLRYADRYSEAVEKFQEMAAPLSHLNNTVYWWTVSHYAGALRHAKRPEEAAYQFSRVFDHCPTRRIAAYRGFRVQSDDQWAGVMSMCQNGREKATLHFIRAITPDALSMDELRKVQEYAPGSQMADVLLLREINKVERGKLGFPFSSTKPFHKGIDRDEEGFSRAHLSDLKALVNETLAGKKMFDPDLWKLSQSYLIFLGGDAEGAFNQLQKTRPGLDAEGALRGSLLDLVFRIAMTKKVDATVENTLLKDLTNLSGRLSKDKADELRQFMDEALAWLYEAQGQTAKALLARRQQYSIWDQKLAMVNDLLKFEAKPNKTLYEKQLMERMHGATNHEQLLEVKGTRLMGMNLLEDAIKVFSSLPESYRRSSGSFNIGADPFEGRIRDIVNCDEMGCGSDKYNKLNLAETMLSLQKKALQEPENAGKYYLLLGNAYYNTTYFGPGWRALDYSRSGGSWGYLGRFESWYTFDPENFDEVVDMTLAESYYDKAAEASRDPEIAALATYMAAKCELNRFYMSGAETQDGYQSHFRELVNNYRNTEIYDQLVRECFYFRAYQN